MKPLIAFAGIVMMTFAGMVVLRENGRRVDTPAPVPIVSAASSKRTATISSGDTVEMEKHLVGGRFTIVEFTADF